MYDTPSDHADLSAAETVFTKKKFLMGGTIICSTVGSGLTIHLHFCGSRSSSPSRGQK